MKLKQSYGKVAGEAQFKIGDKIKFAKQPIWFSSSHKEAWVANWEFHNGIILSICFRYKDHFSFIGSAVMVAPGVAISAKHVFFDDINEIASNEISVLCTGLTPLGLRLWELRHLKTLSSADLCILELKLISQVKPNDSFFLPPISTSLPRVGDKLLILGFAADKTKYPIIRKKGNSGFAAKGDLRVSSGLVSAVFHHGRDLYLLPSLCFQIDCFAKSGISGGGVFNHEGSLIGVLSSSFDEEGPAFVSSIIPALSHQIVEGWPGKISESKNGLIGLYPDRCFIDDISCIIISDDNSEFSYTQWHLTPTS
jgi:hypothetical protein